MLLAAIVVALALATRLLWVVLVPSKPVGDFAMYIEAADHLIEHRAFDSEYVYMPGYVYLVAAVRAMGGGWTAVKLITVVPAGLCAGAVFAIAARLWDRRAAVAAGVAYALWPAGIVMCSVTGTDVIASVVITAAIAIMVCTPRERLWSAVALGVLIGAAAWIRAVALLLIPASVIGIHLLAVPWRAALRQAAITGVVAFVVLVPWAARNQQRYGEWFFSDSHGGLTALVGANPNTDGSYSRSLNRIFEEVTGHALLAEPHREADRAAYQLAMDWTTFSPAYAVGLLAKKAERLLGSEGPLMYWPVFRAGVLREPQRSWFVAHQRAVVAVVEGFWWLLVATWVVGLVVTARRRNFAAWAPVPIQVALAAVYIVFFAEARYQLPIVVLMFPTAAGGAMVFCDLVRDAIGARRLARARVISFAGGCAAIVVVFAGWAALQSAGRVLRERNRFAVSACAVDGKPQVCKWKAAGRTALRGVWDGVGCNAASDGSKCAAVTTVELPPGDFRVRVLADVVAPADADGAVTLRTPGGAITTVPVAGPAAPGMSVTTHHPGGPLEVTVLASGNSTRVWFTGLRVDAVPPGAPGAPGAPSDMETK